jgi:hypothetical protein
MSLTPDTVMKTTFAVRQLEEKLGFWDEKKKPANGTKDVDQQEHAFEQRGF